MQKLPVLALSLCALSLTANARAMMPPLHAFHSVAIAPDGRHVASIESDDSGDATPPRHLVLRTGSGGAQIVALPCGAGPSCVPSSPSWNHDGSRLAFVVNNTVTSDAAIYTVAAGGGMPLRLVRFAGALGTLRYGPDNRLAVLATPHPHKQVGATEPAAPLVGVIGSDPDEQRIAVLRHGALRMVSPAGLFIYEFAWRPDVHGFVATAALGDGDTQWWVAKLIGVGLDGRVRVLHAPDGTHQQLADPVVSPDGHAVAYIAGWMSDFGSNGGDAYLLNLSGPGATPVDLTAGLHATITTLDWQCGGGLTAAALAGPRAEFLSLAPGQPPHTLWSGEQDVSAGGWNLGLACAGGHTAAVRQSFTEAPELATGTIGDWHDISHLNAAQTAPYHASNLTWKSGGLDVQGWLLTPSPLPPGKRPLLVNVHGGPQAAVTPDYLSPRGDDRALLAAGYDVFEPNYRGSFGQGEAFSAADIHDYGGGDFRDIMAGVDAAERATPVDDSRLGILGGSYGGYMAMWAITQTHRFAAAAAHAGVSDWLSIQGEAPQMTADAPDPSFGTLVYNDPGPQLRASPITHMMGVRTPMLITVGAQDVECPMPQSQEFYQAMATLGVPVSFVVYAGEGHGFRKQADRLDERRRTLAWFHRWFNESRPAKPSHRQG
ncbi:prolyl oligopeptidase family serine peptidase [Lichenicoccus sp.]|uniref:S9 family peptidase n=1 Tax=Lichenicoccus sp. TaxID=2781899 RepID=UPI003D13CE9B